ncbi:polysaccharide deacetylase family protein [Actomonas aquatica]|uniref:Polysaccharide deacetylase family protein n=1 Tax=Actomonas aquatica TaxID=2866162 RepID=A0ABZ1C2M2_9BACT|nr:polysaccharide deacetylase family protein [Opitutus sp. WL0086]WRQ85597.1 polysaccharide deacetylase family protein [Opitutus sp. WL0086]
MLPLRSPLFSRVAAAVLLVGWFPLMVRAHEHGHDEEAVAAMTIQERLGYPADAKLLVIHGDDIGLSHSQNMATFRAMEDGVVTSTSVMMTTPWVAEVVNYQHAHPEADIGVHLTLTAEWETFKWGPLAGKDEVPSLVTPAGVFHDNVPDYAAAAKIDEVEREVRAQIDHALAQGIDVTHLDGHMGVMSATPELLQLYRQIGAEYGLPLRLHSHTGEGYAEGYTSIHGAPPATYPDGMTAHYNRVLRELEPGLNLIVLHVAYDDEEMRAITVNKELWGAAWRQIDFDWATDPETRRIIEEEGIILIDSRAIRDALFPQKP